MNANPATRSLKATPSPRAVAIAIAVFFPYGFYLLWNHPTLGKKPAWWLGGIAYVVFALFMLGDNDSGGRSRTYNSRPFSAEQQKAIRESRGLQIVESFGELHETEVDNYINMKEQFAQKGDPFTDTNTENAFLLMMVPAPKWKAFAKKKGLSRQEYFFATNFIFLGSGNGYNPLDKEMHDRELVKVTGEHLSDY